MEKYKTRLILSKVLKFLKVLSAVEPWRKEEIDIHINLIKRYENKETEEYIEEIPFILDEIMVLMKRIKKIESKKEISEILNIITYDINNTKFDHDIARIYSYDWQVDKAEIKINEIKIPDIWVARDWRYINSQIYRIGIKDISTTYYPKGTYGIEVEEEENKKFKSKIYGGYYISNARYLVNYEFLNSNMGLEKDLREFDNLNLNTIEEIINTTYILKNTIKKQFKMREGWILINKDEWKRFNEKIIVI